MQPESRIPAGIVELTLEMLHVHDPEIPGAAGKDDEQLQLIAFQGDGSIRRFFRLLFKGRPCCIAIYPAPDDPRGVDEARAAARIGRHLFHKNVPVPEVYGWDEQTGLLLFEDCGDVKLQDISSRGKLAKGELTEKAVACYDEVIGILCHMYQAGAEGFDTAWCYDTARYDREIMIEKEALYFYRAFWLDFYGGEEQPAVLEEFEDIAGHAGRGIEHGFLHRDFQSRNVMITPRGLRILDYQAGRFGPPGYDLASLLIDPYSGLSLKMQERLLELYIQKLRNKKKIDEQVFRRQYEYLALQRNLQIIGAYAFLFQRRGKVFFEAYIIPALAQLKGRLAAGQFSEYTELRRMVGKAFREFEN